MSGLIATRPIAGIPIRVSTLEEATEWIVDTAVSVHPQPVDVHLANAYTIALADKDEEFRRVLLGGGAVFPDGRPMVWLMKFTRQPIHQVRGPSLFDEVMNHGRSRDVKHFLLGSTEETLKLLQSELERRYPGVHIVGSYSPPFRQMSEAERGSQDDLIRNSGAQIVWVGLGTPKQDFEAQRLASAVSVLAVAVGAAFDFSAGTKQEAPRWMSRAGLEWIYRLGTEPRRLWKRYLVGNAVFLRSVVARWGEGNAGTSGVGAKSGEDSGHRPRGGLT